MTLLAYALGALILLFALALIVVVLTASVDPDVPEAAEAPAYDPEPRCRVVAGSDLDRHRRPIEDVNADLAALIEADPNLASLRNLDLSAYYVTPEGDR